MANIELEFMLARYYKILSYSLFYLSLFKYYNGSKYLLYAQIPIPPMQYLSYFSTHFVCTVNFYAILLTVQGLNLKKKINFNTFKLEIIALYVKNKFLLKRIVI